jgi:hypothetical protein
MADDLIITTDADGTNSKVPTLTRISMEEVSTLNGGAVTAQKVQRVIVATRTGDGTAVDNGPPATEDKQDDAIALLTQIEVNTGAAGGGLTDAELRAAAVPVSLASQPLPTGAATEAGLDDILAAISAQSLLVDTLEALLTSIKTAVEILDNAIAGNEIQADIVTMPAITGAVTANAGTNLNTSALALESGGALDDIVTLLTAQALMLDGLETELTAVKTAVQIIDDMISGNEAQVDVVTMPAIATGTNTIGAVNVKPATAGGLSVHRIVAAASNNAALVKGSPGQVFGWYIYNSNASARKVVLYNAITNPPVPGTTAPKITLVIPASSGANVEFTNGIEFDTGIGIATVTGLADSDNTGVAANDLIINVLYK